MACTFIHYREGKNQPTGLITAKPPHERNWGGIIIVIINIIIIVNSYYYC